MSGNNTEILTELVWEKYLIRFGNGGMETYEKVIVLNPHSAYIDSEKIDPGRVHRVLKMREVNELIQSTFYLLDETNSQDAPQYLYGIETYLGSLSLKPPVNSPTFTTFQPYNIQNAENHSFAERSRDAELEDNVERERNTAQYGNAENLSYERRFHLKTYRIILTLIDMDLIKPISAEIIKKNCPWEQ